MDLHLGVYELILFKLVRMTDTTELYIFILNYVILTLIQSQGSEKAKDSAPLQFSSTGLD